MKLRKTQKKVGGTSSKIKKKTNCGIPNRKVPFGRFPFPRYRPKREIWCKNKNNVCAYSTRKRGPLVDTVGHVA